MKSARNQLIFSTTDIKGIKEIFDSSNTDGLNAISDHYWVLTIDRPTPPTCSITDMMESDIKSIEENEIYCDLIDKFGKDMVSKFVHTNPDNIKDKTIRIINFMMNKYYASDELEIIIYSNSKDIAEVLITIITSNFDIIKQCSSDHKHTHIIIKKK